MSPREFTPIEIEHAGPRLSCAGSSMRTRGFTLVELLVVIAIVAIVAAIAVPSFQGFIASSNASSATNGLLATFEQARSEAIRLRVPVTVCRSLDPEADPPACSGVEGSGYVFDDWGSGWIVFAKTGTNNNAGTVENDNLIIARVPGSAGGTRLVVDTNIAGATQFFTYSPDGMREAGPAGFNALIDYRDASTTVLSSKARCIEFSIAGRGRIYPPLVNGTCG